MRRLVLSTLALLAAVPLGGCNMVFSERPLVAERDAARVKAFRPGLWAAYTRDCEFDAALPTDRWPTCADPWRMDRSGRLTDRSETPQAYLIAPGEPLVLQLPAEDFEQRPIFLFAGVKPTARDDRGRIVRFSAWPVFCGPSRPFEEGGVDRLSASPLPGLEIVGDGCRARSLDQVRTAAQRSEAWAGPNFTFLVRWVSDEAR